MTNKTGEKKPKILFYDIETKPLLAYIWRLGEQGVYHSQLAERGNAYDIICISYAWDDGKPAKTLHWGYQEQDSRKMIQEFDKIVKQATVPIGKNSDRFDVKHINTQRMLQDLDPFPDWADCADDVEKQLRKHFVFPSQSLDYISKLMGLGGKLKMEMQDWVDIVERRNKDSFTKMLEYNRKDVEDTRAIWNKVKRYIHPKFNVATFYGDFRCVNCGSQDLRKDGVRHRGKTTYQVFFCKGHNGYAGRVPVLESGKLGKMG